MQLKKRILASLLVLVVTTASIGIFFILNTFHDNSSRSEAPIPANANWVFKADISALGKETMYDILFKTKDEQTIAGIRKIIQERMADKGEKISLGINMKTDIIVYQITENDIRFTCFLFELDDETEFKNNINAFLTNNLRAAHKNNWGLIVSPSKSNSQTQILVQKWINSPLVESIKGTAPLAIQSIKDKSFSFEITPEKDRFTLSGSVQIKKDEVSSFPFDLKKDGLYLKSVIFPAAQKTKLAQLPISKYLPFSKLDGAVFTFNGVFLEGEKPDLEGVFGMLPVPVMNGIFHFNEAMPVDSMLARFPASIKTSKNALVFGNITYQLVQLDLQTVFVGVNPKSVINSSTDRLFELSGDFTTLTQIGSESSFITTMATSAAPVRVTTTFLKSFSKGEIILKKGKNDQHKLTGELKFKNGKGALSEMVNFAVVLYNLDSFGRLAP